MAFRPAHYLIEGELDNTTAGRVSGWMQFLGMPRRVTLNLTGDFHADVHGARIHLYGMLDQNEDEKKAVAFMRPLKDHQTGRAGDITAGLPPYPYGLHPYVEWYSIQNGRVVLELEPGQITRIDKS